MKINNKIFKLSFISFIGIFFILLLLPVYCSCSYGKEKNNNPPKEIKSTQLKDIIKKYSINIDDYYPHYDPEKYPPKLLMFCKIHPLQLKETAQFWGEKTGIRGFMLGEISEWDLTPDHGLKNIKLLKEMNNECSKYGIDSNFIKISLGHNQELNLSDDASWLTCLVYFHYASITAREGGFKGIALDTEPYRNKLWSMDNPLYASFTQEELNQIFYRRGQELQRTIIEGFPEAEILIFPEGNFYQIYPQEGNKPYDRIYAYWLPFFQGILSVKSEKGVVVCCERSYRMKDPVKLLDKFKKIKDTFDTGVQDKKYWEQKCSIALGLWPLGKTFENKDAQYSPQDFQKQLLTAQKLCPRYVWIYTHGASWWQMTPEDVQYYSQSPFRLWSRKNQILPTHEKLNEYMNISGHALILKKYFIRMAEIKKKGKK